MAQIDTFIQVSAEKLSADGKKNSHDLMLDYIKSRPNLSPVSCSALFLRCIINQLMYA